MNIKYTKTFTGLENLRDGFISSIILIVFNVFIKFLIYLRTILIQVYRILRSYVYFVYVLPEAEDNFILHFTCYNFQCLVNCFIYNFAYSYYFGGSFFFVF